MAPTWAIAACSVGASSGASWRLATAATSPSGIPAPSVATERLRPCLSRFTGEQLWGVATSGQSVWAPKALGRIWRLDARRNQVTATVETTKTQGGGTPRTGHLTAGAGAVWAGGDGQLLRLDPRSGQPVAKIPWVA